MTRNTLIGTAIAALASTTLLAGCSSSDHAGMAGPTASATASGQQSPHNQADIGFAQQMIPHHTQAVDMAAMVPGHTANPKILDLAARIQKAQQPEIAQMTGWLTAWGATAIATMPGMSDGHFMPGMGGTGAMPGMMSDQDMTALGQVKDAEFDRMWLQMMIRHHQGAVQMATTELAQGSNSDAKTLAQAIIAAQQAEITEMHALLDQV
jgi:uncharacterized protein (DUF305 family)